MNDLSMQSALTFHTEVSDYGNCIDVSSKGVFPPVRGGFEPNPTNQVNLVRHFLCRINRRDVPALIEALQQAIQR